jgi:hypothetical protein
MRIMEGIEIIGHEGKYLTPSEVAKFLHVSYSSARNFIESEKLKEWKIETVPDDILKSKTGRVLVRNTLAERINKVLYTPVG